MPELSAKHTYIHTLTYGNNLCTTTTLHAGWVVNYTAGQLHCTITRMSASLCMNETAIVNDRHKLT